MLGSYDPFPVVWSTRRENASLGVWNRDTLLGAALVRDNCFDTTSFTGGDVNEKLVLLAFEYIFVDSVCRGSGLGTQLLRAVIAEVPAIYLIPVNRYK